MKKKILTLALATMIAVSFTACGGNSDTKKEETATTEAKKEVTYQSILDDYSQKLKDTTPGLVKEYKDESKDHKGDVEKLAEISNDKVEELAKICNDGVEEMAELQLKNGDEYETYEDWAGKLQDVYQDEAKTITDAYMDSAK